MNDRDNTSINNKRIITKKRIIDFFNKINLPKNLVCNYDEKDNYIEFMCGDITYAVLIDGENWEDIKQELLLQKERKLIESFRIQELEKQDSLTKLYNKEFSRHMIEEFLEASVPGSNHALMIVDIDNFETVNENLGYLFGDTVLMNIADNLRSIFYNTDIAARIGGDEFLIFLKDVSSQELLQAKAEEICNVFMNTYTGEHNDYTMSCSIGIAVYPTDGADFMKLFKRADTALYYARQIKGNHFSFYKDIEKQSDYVLEDSYDKYLITKTIAYGSSSFDKEITAFAFDIMSRTKDVNSAINLLLNKVRVQFNCNHVCIIEKSITDAEFNITYLCGKNGIETPKNSRYQNILDSERYENRFNEDGIYIVNETSLIQPENDNKLFEKLGIQALLQCGIFENGLFKGCVSIDDCEKPRNWTRYEIDSLVTITKIISSYLLKMRASERANQQLYRIKNYDSLTGLPTLHKFKRDVKRLLKDHPDDKFAIIYSDISQFKYINDSLGYDIGDRILYDYAMLLSNNELFNKALARISGDNFLSVVKFKNEKIIENLVLEINEQFNAIQKSKYPGNKFVIVSGVSVIDSSEDITVAIDNANIARKSAKPSPKSVCKFFKTAMKIKLQKEAEITNSMEQALRNGEFIVYLQPKIGLSENKIIGAEALVRWKKPDNTLVPPNDFIPIFEKNGFVVNLDFYIYEEVCKILRSWMDEGRDVVPVSVNVSRIHLNDENFVNEIQKLVDSYNIPYHLIELELTESIFLNNAEVALGIMRNLRKLGFIVSIDDFGAGYSCLNLLKYMATDVIKLDKEFFGQGEMQKEEQIIVSSIISLAKQLNMKVLSEGVETQTQSNFLKSVFCDMAQGYLYSKPMPVIEFENLVWQG
jgi:diguanylate cyclase (GGDEF)-like protein